MKKYAFAALLLTTLLMLGGCKKNEDGATSSDASSQPTSGQEESSKINDLFPDTDEPEVSSEPQSSLAEEFPTVASPIDGSELALSKFEQMNNETVTWGPGHDMDKLNRSTACLSLQEKYGESGGLFIVPTEEKVMYLTFDEGYENGYTEKILDVLKEKECPAVFFVTLPYVKSNPELIQRMIDEGHIVGNHSVTHPKNGEPSLSIEDAVEDIAGLHNYMVENFNYQMTLFRPPAGLFSERTLEIAKALGYKSVLWSYAYYDYNTDEQPDPASALKKVASSAHPGGIPLLHAVSSTNTQILGDVIDSWRNDGYTLAKLQ